MPSIQSVLDRVAFVTKDYDHDRWSLAEITGWLNDAVAQIASLDNRAAAQYKILTLRQGSRQDLRVIDPEVRWMRLYELVCNVNGTEPTGTTIRAVYRTALDNVSRNWRAAPPTATAVKEYATDVREPFTFDVNPPVANGTKVYALCAVKPPRCAALVPDGSALADANEDLPLADGYDIPTVDYILYRLFSKDANDPTYVSRAASHLQTFQLALQVETKDASAA